MPRAYHQEHIESLLARMLKVQIVSRFTLVAATEGSIFHIRRPVGPPRKTVQHESLGLRNEDR